MPRQYSGAIRITTCQVIQVHIPNASGSWSKASRPIELEVELLYRTKRTVRLTSAGEVFLIEARKVVAQADYATSEQVKALVEGRIHAGLLHPPFDISLLSYEVIYKEPLIVIVSDTHRLAGGAPKPVSVRELSQEPIVSFPRKIGPVLYDSIIAFCQQSGFSPNIIQEVFQQRTILGLVAAGLGIAVIHSSA
ncbi:MAG: LysR substrate-binding domain-containing protein [Cyanobacteria bacterium P01_D01_bin.1]